MQAGHETYILDRFVNLFKTGLELIFFELSDT